MDNDPFKSLFGLEDQFYNEGFELGMTDGKKAGRIEGQIFGIEKGFEKFVVAGRIHGRCAIWKARIEKFEEKEERMNEEELSALQLSSLPDNPRLLKHIQASQTLVDPQTMSYENNEDAISDYEDRIKRAKAKMKVIEKIIGEDHSEEQKGTDVQETGPKKPDEMQSVEGNIEDIKSLNIRC
ncbi:MAG: hypothetical protein M1823_000597 [Watsoniomyces obsoletus]|nr:MAG: hypothetical protein M1823_000597 [Watsoniomyces obsoletus]